MCYASFVIQAASLSPGLLLPSGPQILLVPLDWFKRPVASLLPPRKTTPLRPASPPAQNVLSLHFSFSPSPGSLRFNQVSLLALPSANL